MRVPVDKEGHEMVVVIVNHSNGALVLILCVVVAITQCI